MILYAAKWLQLVFDAYCDCVSDSVIIFWKLSETETPSVNIFQEDEEDNKENWCMHKCLR